MINKHIKSIFITSFLSTLLFVASIILFNILFHDIHLQADLTKNKLYTLTSHTKSVLSKIDDPITIEFYTAKNLPSHVLLEKKQSLHIIEEFVRHSKGKIVLNVISSDVSNDQFKKLNAMGISKLQLNIFENDQFKLIDTFSGLIIYYEDKKESIPVVLNPSTLEYDLSLLINKLIAKRQYTIAFVNNNLNYLEENFSIFNEFLSKNFNVISIPFSDLNNQLIDLALIIQPAELTESDLAQLDTYSKNGNESFFFIDQYHFENLSYSDIESNLDYFFSYFGISFDQHLILDNNCADVRFKSSHQNFTYNSKFLHKFPYYPIMSKRYFNSEHPTITQYSSVVFPFSSSFYLEESIDKNFSNSILIYSNDSSWKEFPPHNTLPQRTFTPFNMNSYPMLIRINGFFEDKDVPALKTNLSMLLVGSSAVIKNNTLLDYNLNAPFFSNLIEWEITNNSDLVLPVKKSITANLNSVTKNEKFILKWFSMLFMPILILLYIVINYLLRIREQYVIKK